MNRWLTNFFDKLLPDKFLIVRYVATSLIKWFVIVVGAVAVIFGLFWVTGVYGNLERALDLKYDSPFITVPIIGFAALAVLCFFVGFLMYFHKYKRAKSRTKFGEAFSKMLTEPTEK